MEREKPTPEQVREWYGEQDEAGNDLDWLRYNLSLTPTERYRKHQRALQSVLKLREAFRLARHRRTGEGA
jgi:hypothetical protein